MSAPPTRCVLGSCLRSNAALPAGYVLNLHGTFHPQGRDIVFRGLGNDGDIVVHISLRGMLRSPEVYPACSWTLSYTLSRCFFNISFLNKGTACIVRVQHYLATWCTRSVSGY